MIPFSLGTMNTPMAIGKVLDQLHWNFSVFNKNAYEKVSILNETLRNVLLNFIQNKLVTINSKVLPLVTSS